MTVKLIGNDDLSLTNGTIGESVKYMRFAAEKSGSLSDIQIGVGTGNSGNAKVAILSDNSSNPGTVLGSSGSTAFIAGMNLIPLSAPADIVAGTYYWLAFITSASGVSYISTGYANKYKSATYSSFSFSNDPTGLSDGASTYQIAGFGTTGGRLFQVIVC